MRTNICSEIMEYLLSRFITFQRERERKYSKTREEIRRSAESFGENIAMNPAISVRGVGLTADIQMSMGISEVTHFNG